MQIGALWTILYASLIDLLCFLKPFLKREGDFLAVAERVSAPFAVYLHFVTTPFLLGELGVPAHPVFQVAKILPHGIDAMQLPSGTPEQFRELSPPIHSQLELPVKQK